MNFGISSYALTWSIGVPGYEAPSSPLSVMDLITLAKDCRVGLVQIADNMPLHNMSESELKALRHHADQAEVAIEVGTRGTSPEHLIHYLDIAKALGSPLVRTLITEPDLRQAMDHLTTVLPDYKQSDIKLAIENHGLHTTSQLISLFEIMDHSHLGCCLDTVNSFGALEAPQAVIQALAPYTINLHLKDFDIQRVDHQMGFAVLGAPAGSGSLDVEALMEEISKHHKCASAILELWTPFTRSINETIQLEQEWLRQSLMYLESIDLG